MLLAEIAPWQVLVVLLIVLLLFGGRIPDTMRNLGKGLSEFKKGMKEGEEGSRDASREQEKEDSAKKA